MNWGRASDRILLYLLDRAGLDARSILPPDVTQDGVCMALDLERTTATKALQGLERRRLVRSERARVRGLPRRRTVFFLTGQGLAFAREVRRAYEEAKVIVVDLDGRVHQKMLFAVVSMLPAAPPLYDVVAAVKKGRIDLRELRERVTEKTVGPSLLRQPRPPPHFYGREQQVRRMRELLRLPHLRCIAVSGIAGIGKTTLVARVATLAYPEGRVFWFDVGAETSARLLLEALAEFLSLQGRRTLSSQLAAATFSEASELLPTVARELAGLPTIVVIDNVDRSPEQIVNFLGALLERLGSPGDPKLVAVGREIPRLYTRADVRVHGFVEEIVLEELDEKASYELMARRGLPKSQFEEVYRVTRGHPLFIELIDPKAGPPERDVRDYVEEQVLEALDDRERTVLERVVVFAEPVEPEALLGEDGDFTTVARLTRRHLLREVGYNEFGVHDLLREVVYSRIPKARVRQLHARAAEYYEGRPGALATLKALQHLLYAGQVSDAARVAVQRGNEALRAGFAVDLQRRLDDISVPPNLDRATESELYVLRGDLNRVLGNWDTAIGSYGGALTRARSAGNGLAEARCYWGIGDIAMRRHQPRKAIRNLNEAREKFETLGELRGVADSLYVLGCVEEKRGGEGRSQRFFEKALELAARVDDPRLQGMALYGMARTADRQGRYRDAVDLHKKALALFERAGDLVDAAKVHTALGGNLMELGEMEEGARRLHRALEIARALGDADTQMHSLYNLSSYERKKGNLQEAIILIEQAEALARRLKDPRALARCLMARANLLARKGDLEAALPLHRQAISILEQGRLQYDLAVALLWAAKACSSPALRDESRAYLTRAVEVSEERGYDALTRTAREMLGQLSGSTRL